MQNKQRQKQERKLWVAVCSNTINETIMRITVNNILDSLIKEPTLAYGGFHPSPAEASATRGDLITHINEVQLCVDWLGAQELGKRITDRSPSSYYLKHAVEFAAGKYVSNGCLIVACIIMGVPYQRYGHDHPNASCAVKRHRRNRPLHGEKGKQYLGYCEFKPLQVDSPPTDRTGKPQSARSGYSGTR